MSFETVAKRIIKNSIVSSVYVDDQAVEPFENFNAGNKFYGVSKGLYDSFKKQNRSLDFYKFRIRKDWRKDSNYLFKNRDLLILDWQLNSSTGLTQEKTLEILHEAVRTDNLHFVSIYTEKDKTSDFPSIFYSIKAFFTNEYTDDVHEKCSDFMSYVQSLNLEHLDLESSDKIDEFGGLLREVGLNKPEALNDLETKIRRIREELGNQEFGKFCIELKKIDSNPNKAVELFGYYVNEEIYNDSAAKDCKFNFDHIDDDFIVINHTIIKLSNKETPKPRNFFDDFTNAILKFCSNPLTLTALEIKTLIKEGSGFIGKDADAISDAALYYHKSLKQDIFFDFILEIWKSHILSFVGTNSDTLLSLKEDFWKGYKTKRGVTGKLALLKKDKINLHKELANLNTYYNTFHLVKEKSDIIKFGDVFVELNDNGTHSGNFMLNITAHCDCKTTENIKNNFYFISGDKKILKRALEDGDGEYNSYLKINEEILAIGWKQRPIVLNLPANQMTDFVLEGTDGNQKKRRLKYLATLKENYAQRMANNSFSFAMRVGIDFAGLKKSNSNG